MKVMQQTRGHKIGPTFAVVFIACMHCVMVMFAILNTDKCDIEHVMLSYKKSRFGREKTIKLYGCFMPRRFYM